MVRYISCLAVALLMGTPLWAGELDREFRGKAPAAPAAPDVVRPLNKAAASWPMLTGEARADARKGSELDNEPPAQSWGRGWGGWGRGWGGWGRGWGWGGWGRGWGGWGRGWGWGWGRGWGGWGGWGGGWGGWGWGWGIPVVGWGGWGGWCW